MRRSQAPSFKTKLPCNTSENNNRSNLLQSKQPEKTLGFVRSIETVLDLLNNSSSTIINNVPLVESESSVIKNHIDNVQNSEIINLGPCTATEIKNEKSYLDQESLTIYNVVYGKQTKKKHKTWEGDGTLEIRSKYLTLKDETGKVVGTVPCNKARKLEEGERIYIGSKEVELIELVNANQGEKNKISKPENSVVSAPEEKLKRKSQISGKRFLCQKINYSSGLVLPEPSASHQWYFNKNNLPISPVYIEEGLSKKLRSHQYAGVSFLYECIMGFKENNLTGAILADEMGLGKTLQCIALIWTLLKQGPYGNQPILRKVLIVTPCSLTMNWHNEFIKWLGRVKIVPYVVSPKHKPSHMRGPIMIISYEMLIRCFDEVEKHHFDLLICDEGHRLKNSNIRTTQMLNQLNCSRRILLTGTPIQNDLQEFFSLVDFVNPNALGTPSEFRRRFEEPIIAARQPNVNEEILSKGRECTQELKRITGLFLLRRTREILKDYLPPRYEIVVFCKVTDIQRFLYNSLIDLFMSAKENILGHSHHFVPLELITALKKLCCHPTLLRNDCYEQNLKTYTLERNGTPLIEVSGKVLVTVNILKELREASPKEKVVLVSNWTQSLDLLGKILNSIGYSTCRLDGSTPATQRSKIVENFNSFDSKTFVFLLSSKAGGTGLNLTGASRLILFDSDWNPATDLQAVSRIWRDGQKHSVFIYRLTSTGTIEEKIYQRQISKQGLCEGIVDPDSAKSIKLANEELKDIFSPCEIQEDCLTHNALNCHCSKQGEIPVPEVEEEERSCQLMKQSNASLKISELFHWEHHGNPYNLDFLSELCLRSSEKNISFIFRSCKN